MNNIKVKRFMAYLIDICIISALVMLVSQINFLHPNEAKYNTAVAELNDFLEVTTNTTVDDAYLSEYATIIKDVSYYGISYSLVQIVVILLYLTLFPYFNKGMTIGKRIFKIKVVNKNGEDKKVTFFQHFGKAILCPIWTSILLYNTLFNILTVISVLIFKDNIFLNIYMYGSLAICAFCYVDVVMALANNQGESLTDKITKTRVMELC